MYTKTLGWGLVSLVNRVRKALGFLLVFSAVGGRAWAIPPPVPEIDPGFAASALTLVIGGLLMLTDKRRRN